MSDDYSFPGGRNIYGRTILPFRTLKEREQGRQILHDFYELTPERRERLLWEDQRAGFLILFTAIIILAGLISLVTPGGPRLVNLLAMAWTFGLGFLLAAHVRRASLLRKALTWGGLREWA